MWRGVFPVFRFPGKRCLSRCTCRRRRQREIYRANFNRASLLLAGLRKTHRRNAAPLLNRTGLSDRDIAGRVIARWERFNFYALLRSRASARLPRLAIFPSRNAGTDNDEPRRKPFLRSPPKLPFPSLTDATLVFVL
jgi:hypothetical protein